MSLGYIQPASCFSAMEFIGEGCGWLLSPYMKGGEEVGSCW